MSYRLAKSSTTSVQQSGIWVWPHHELDVISAFLHCGDLRLEVQVLRVAGGPLLQAQAQPSVLQAACPQPGKVRPCGAAQRTPCRKHAVLRTTNAHWCGYVIVKISCRTCTPPCEPCVRVLHGPGSAKQLADPSVWTMSTRHETTVRHVNVIYGPAAPSVSSNILR